MKRSKTGYLSAATMLCMLTGCASTPSHCDSRYTNPDQAAHEAHANFVNAINSNDLDQFLGMITDDVVFMAPNSPRLVGKDAVSPWAAGYYDAFHTTWIKTSLEFVVNGDWAFEQYAYQSDDTEKATGKVYRDTGKGIIIYHHDADGVWRVARDAWNSDIPAASE